MTCSGCGLARMIACDSAAVEGPIFLAASSMRSGVQKAYRRVRTRHVLGDGRMPSPDGRARVTGDPHAAMDTPSRPVACVARTSTTWRISRDGTE